MDSVVTPENVADMVELALQCDDYRQVIVSENIDGEVFINMPAPKLFELLAQKDPQANRLPAGTQLKVENLHSRLVGDALHSGDSRVWAATRKRIEGADVPSGISTSSIRLRRLRELLRERRPGLAGGAIVTELLNFMRESEKQAASINEVAGLERPAEEGVLTSFAQRWPLLERSKQTGQLVEGWQKAFEAQQIKCPPQASNSELQYQNRAPYVAIIQGPPGSGKTALADRLPQTVTEAEELPGCSNPEFKAVLKDSFGGPRPLQFAMDLSRRDFSMGWPDLVAFAADDPARWLGLICLLAWADTIQRGIHMEALISRLSDWCLVHLEAYHVWQALHQFFGRERSFLHVVLDEAAVLKDVAKEKTRLAFSEIPLQVGKVSRAVTFWLTLLSTRLMGASPPTSPPLGDSPSQGRDKVDSATSKKSRESDLIDQTTFSGQQQVLRVFLPSLSPESAEKLLRITCDMGGINVPKRLPKAVAVLLEYANSRPRNIEAAVAAMGGQSQSLNKAVVSELQAFISHCDHERLAQVIRSLKSLITQQEYFKNGIDRFGSGKLKFETMRAMVVHSLRGVKVQAKAPILEGLPATWSDAVESGHVDNGSDERDYVIPKMPYCILDTFLGYQDAKLRPLVNLFGETTACYNYDDKEVTDLTALAFQLKLAETAGEQTSTLSKILNLDQEFGPDHPLGMEIKLKGLSYVYKRLRNQWSEEDFEKYCNSIRDYHCPSLTQEPTPSVAQPRVRGTLPTAGPSPGAEQEQREETRRREAVGSIKNWRGAEKAVGQVWNRTGEVKASRSQVSAFASGKVSQPVAVASWAGHPERAPGDVLELLDEGDQGSPGPMSVPSGLRREVSADCAAAPTGPAAGRAGLDTAAVCADGELRARGEALDEENSGDGVDGLVAVIAPPADALASPPVRRLDESDLAQKGLEGKNDVTSPRGRTEDISAEQLRDFPVWGTTGSSVFKGCVKRPRKERSALSSPRALSPETGSLRSPVREASPRTVSERGVKVADEGVGESPPPTRKRKKENGEQAEGSAIPINTAGKKQGSPNQGPGLFWQSVPGAHRPDSFGLLPRADTVSGPFGSPGNSRGGANKSNSRPKNKSGRTQGKMKMGARGKPAAANLDVLRVQLQSKSNLVFHRGILSPEELTVLAQEEWAKQYSPTHPCNLFLLCLDQRVPDEADLPRNTLVIDVTLWRKLYTELGRFKRNIIDTLQTLRSAPPGDRVGHFNCPVCSKDYNFASWFLKHLLSAHQMEEAEAKELVNSAKAEAAED